MAEVQHEVAVGFEDLAVLSEGDVDVFLLDWATAPAAPPYYVTVDGREFAYTGETLLVKGHGASIARVVQEHEAAGRLALLVERGGRYLIYAFDPNAPAEAAE